MTGQDPNAPEWVRHIVTPQEVIDAYVKRRVNDPSLLSGNDDAAAPPLEPTYDDFIAD